MSFAYSYALALKQQELDFYSVVEKLNILNQGFQEESEINLFFLSPTIPVEAKKQALKKVLEHLSYKGLICSFLYLLLDKKKWGEWPAILNHLNKLKQKAQGFVLAKVESASPLSEGIKEKLIQKLSHFLGKQVKLQESINPHLMGLVQLLAEGFVFDDHLSYHLKRMGTI